MPPPAAGVKRVARTPDEESLSQTQRRHCERSEAIHGRKSGGMDCFVGFASSQ